MTFAGERGSTRRRLAALGVAVLALSNVGAKADERVPGDSRVIAELPVSPGFPEGVVIKGRGVYVTTPAQNGNFDPAVVYEVDLRRRAIARSWQIAGAAGEERALVGAATDADGRLYVLDLHAGVVRLTPSTGEQEGYAAIPDLPVCTVESPGPCSPTSIDRPPFPNDIVFLADGSALVTDSFQATIWRIPPGGGSAEPWFQHPRLDTPFGPNGIRLTPDRSRVVFAVTVPGEVLALPLDHDPGGHDPELVATFEGDGPDNLTFGASGRLYVSLAFTDAVAVVDGDGAAVARYTGPATSPDGDVPWDAPAGLALDPVSRSLIVANHALVRGVADPSRFILFDVYVDDVPDALIEPVLP